MPLSCLEPPTGLSRRKMLLAGACLPALLSCATDLTAFRERPLAALAQELGVCSVAYAVLRAGRPERAVTVSGCGQTVGKPEAIFQAASLTKPVVAFAALGLVKEGRLKLDAPVSIYLPSGYTHFHKLLARAPGDPHDMVPAGRLAHISLANLLNHTSGLPNWAGEKLHPEFAPGERWGYSGEGFMLLQSVIEAVTGMDLAAYCDKQVFAPLGMLDSSLVWREVFADRAVSGAVILGFKNKMRFQKPLAAASLYTTATDYAKFMAALLADDDRLSLVVSRPVEVDKPLGLQWGLGWGIEQVAGGPNIWQWGNNPGFRAFAMASTASKDGFVVLTNSERGMALAASLAHAVLPTAHNAFRFPWVG